MLAAARLTGFAGLNVTHPCKQTVLEHLGHGAANSPVRMAAQRAPFA